jgi:uncharacterized membrane protein
MRPRYVWAMGPRNWILALVVAGGIAIGAVLITNAVGPSSSPVFVLVTNGMWITGLAGALVFSAALVRLWLKRHHARNQEPIR